MKKTVLSSFCLLGALSLFSQTLNNVILLLNIGQSNVVGRAQHDPANVITPAAGTWWYKKSTNSLEPLIDGVGEGISHATDYSMNPMLGKRVKDLTGHDVIIVPAGCGNTFIAAWQKDANSLYTHAKTMWQAAIAYCNANNITISAKYAHWLQGENDAGFTETDGYYVMLNQLTNDLVSDVGVEKVFATRIGYDPIYTAAANSEKIMKAQKILAFNNPNFIMDSYAPPSFTYANGKMAWDQTHHTLLGLNEEANDIATAIQHYRTTAGKVPLTENVVSLQSVTNGYINLTQEWAFEFANSLADTYNNATMKFVARDWQTAAAGLPYTSDGGIVIDSGKGLAISRPFSSATFTLETRFKMNTPEASTAVAGNGGGDNYDRLFLHHNTATSSAYILFGTATDVYHWDLGAGINMSNYHTLKLTQAGGVLKLYLDGVQQGPDKVSNNKFTMAYIGMASASPTHDMKGTIDYFRIKDNVNGTVLPLKFKSFKATNIK